MFVYYAEFQSCPNKRLASQRGLHCEPAGDFGFLRSDCGASVGRVSGLFAWQVIVTREIMGAHKGCSPLVARLMYFCVQFFPKGNSNNRFLCFGIRDVCLN